jgi:hypothetical protein
MKLEAHTMVAHRIALIVTLFLASTALAQQNEPLPTMQELQQLRDQKQWQPLLQKLSKVIVLKGNLAQSYDRYELLMMKGEAHAQLKQGPQAIQSFNDAAKEAKDQKDKAAVASSTALLFKRAQNFVYKRKSPTTQASDAKTIDVLDIEKRKEGFAALAADEYAALEGKAKNATKAPNLGGVIDIMKSLGDLRNAELASGGDTKLADQLIAPLAAHTKDLSSKVIATDRKKVEEIEKSANILIEVPDRSRPGTSRAPGATRYKKRGLMSTDSQTLKNIIQECNNIADGDKQLADEFGDAGKPLMEVVKEAQQVADKATAVLNADYTAVRDTPGTTGGTGTK